jgi:sacsin
LAKGDKAIEEKANYLVNYLSQMAKKWPVHFLQQLSLIKFIPAHQVPADLQNLYDQFNGGELICFKDSVPSSTQHLVWTLANILPPWATPDDAELAVSLGIDTQPTLRNVLLHCSTLCNDLAKQKSSETTNNKNSDELCLSLTNVMKDIYHFMMKNKNDIDIQNTLKDIPCIVVEDGRKLVFPRQVIIEMIEDDLRPYLFKLPLELGEFHSFFCKIGATVKPTLKQFSYVLEAIYYASKERKLNPEENRLSDTAIRCFFACLRSTQQANFDGIEALYFLTKDGSLKNMNFVLFNDRPKFADRVKDYDCEEPETFNLDMKCLEALPEKLKPKFLSELVTENLHPDFHESCEPQDPACSLKKHFDLFLSDLNFWQGMTRVAKHFCSKSGIQFDKIEMKRKLQQIGSTFIECRPQLQTLLFNSKKKENIPGSEKHRTEFVDETGCIFIQHGIETVYELAEILTSFVVQVLGNYIGTDGNGIIQRILNLDDMTKIEQKLNDRDITLESNISVKKFNQGPGDLIDDEFLCFLTQNPSHYFKYGEIVGYLENDVYILAKIVSETGSKTATGNFNFGKKYKIDLGQNQVRSLLLIIFKHVL